MQLNDPSFGGYLGSDLLQIPTNTIYVQPTRREQREKK